MDVSLFVTRLQARLTGVREIDAAAGLEAAMRGNRVAPAAYVVPLSEAGSELAHTGDVDQRVHQVIGVIQVIDSLAPTGAPGVLDLDALRRQVKNALIGWVPDTETGEPVLFLGGQLVQFEGDGRLWWSDEFHLTSYYRSNP